MKSVESIVAVMLAAAALLACDKSPLEQISDLQLTLSPDSIVVGVRDSSPITAAVVNSTGTVQYVSRDESVATVNAAGEIGGVAIGSTYVVATLTGRPDVRDSVSVRVHAGAQLTLSADSTVVGLYYWSGLAAALSNSSGTVQYVSRKHNVATVNSSGVITGVGVGSTYVVATLQGRPDVRDSARVRVHADSCSGARPDFGGVATAEERMLFSYDVNEPLNLQKTFESTNNGVEVSTISFDSPDGGRVTGLMWDPVTRTDLRPGMVIMHGHPATARHMTGMAENYARFGAVVIAIDAPFARRAAGPIGMTYSPLDRTEQIQVIKDLQRAVDVLRSVPKVNVNRIAFVGASWGGATGALFVGIERRLRAAALVVGHGGQVSHASGPKGFMIISGMPCANRVAWIRAMAPIEPIRFVGNANVPLLLQNGRFDEFIPAADAAELHAAAPEPKDVRWYDTGHNLSPTAAAARLQWLHEKIGLDAPGGN